VQNANWEINIAAQPEASILWLQCLGVDTVYVSDQRSQEIYKDTKHPEKFAGVLPVLYDNGRGDVLYATPRRYPARARVVDARRLEALHPPQGNVDLEVLRAYADLVENGPDAPPTLTRPSPDEMRVRARIEPGQSLVVQETYDPAWHAWAGATPLAIHKDAMGFLAISAPPGDQEILLQFVTPWENRVGRVLTLLSLLVLVLLGRAAFGARRQA